MHRFWANTEGNFAVVFAFAILPTLGAVGMAVDYSRAVTVQSFIQSQADSAALGAVQGGAAGDSGPLVDYVRDATIDRYGAGDWIDKLEVSGTWVSATDFQVSVTGAVPVTIMTALPGFPEEVAIAATATARVDPVLSPYQPPTVAYLEPEAADYNRIYAYCYDKAATPKRREMTAIADNAGTKYTYSHMPNCDPLSYKLMNVRNARTQPWKWDGTGPGVERYEHFTDTTIKDGKEKYDLGGLNILETILCDTVEQCRPKSKGGIIPEGTGRTPKRADKKCSENKYMYYGWEDRPGGDRDFNDIRLVIRCPVGEKEVSRTVRLVY